MIGWRAFDRWIFKGSAIGHFKGIWHKWDMHTLLQKIFAPNNHISEHVLRMKCEKLVVKSICPKCPPCQKACLKSPSPERVSAQNIWWYAFIFSSYKISSILLTCVEFLLFRPKCLLPLELVALKQAQKVTVLSVWLDSLLSAKHCEGRPEGGEYQWQFTTL